MCVCVCVCVCVWRAGSSSRGGSVQLVQLMPAAEPSASEGAVLKVGHALTLTTQWQQLTATLAAAPGACVVCVCGCVCVRAPRACARVCVCRSVPSHSFSHAEPRVGSSRAWHAGAGSRGLGARREGRDCLARRRGGPHRQLSLKKPTRCNLDGSERIGRLSIAFFK